MARPVTMLVIFFVAFNLFAATASGLGVTQTLGLNQELGGDEAVQDRVESGQDVSSGTSTGSTLFGMYNVLTGQVGNFYDVIYPGLNMLERGGVPSEITHDLLGNLFSIMIFIDIISFLRGWGL